MPGRIVRICPPRTIDASQLQASQGIVITLAERIDASQFERCDLIVRVHSTPDIGGAGTLVVGVYSDGFTPDDPSQDFFGLTPLGSQTVDANTTAGAVLVDEITADLGSMLVVRATFTRRQRQRLRAHQRRPRPQDQLTARGHASPNVRAGTES